MVNRTFAFDVVTNCSMPFAYSRSLGSALEKQTRLIKLRCYFKELLVNGWSTTERSFEHLWKRRNPAKYVQKRLSGLRYQWLTA